MGKKEEELPPQTKAELEALQQTMPRPLLFRRFLQIKKPDINTLTLPAFRTNRVKESMKRDKKQPPAASAVSPRLDLIDSDEEKKMSNLALLDQKRVDVEGIYSNQDREKDIQKMKTYFETTMNPM